MASAPGRSLGFLCAAVLCAAGGARAQGLSSNAEEPRAGEEIKGDTRVAEIDEVERGFYLSVDYGPNYYLDLPGAGFVRPNPNWVHPGTRMGVRVGYDILNNIQLEGFVLANFNEGEIAADVAEAGGVTGDLSHFAPGVAVRFDYITSEDQRFFAYVRAGVGYALWFPAELTGAAGSVHTDASLGIEYYTKLRHLSAGLEVDFQALIAPMAFGFQVYPTLKYTF
ncbi:MAG: adventurous gliding motility protein CglE [Deltaproteobacteria bacterium]|nr:adventurous gliding motility protein CglE [Deltaproteobacteria bacterium]